MKERPILFNGEMVRAVLDGRKTQTRRVMKPQPTGNPFPLPRCPYGAPGDLLWVRETWRCDDPVAGWVSLNYKATPHPKYDRLINNLSRTEYDQAKRMGFHRSQTDKWRPSIHMLRWASRITLRVTDVRVERVQEISAENAIAEGCRDTKPHDPLWDCTALQDFCTLWDSINAARGFGWDANPFCWVISFERIEP